MSSTKIASPEKLHYYYFEKLGEDDKKLYQAVLDGLMAMQPTIDMKPFHISFEKINQMSGMVVADHPEIFWINTNFMSCRCTDTQIVTEMLVNYTMSKTQRERWQKEIDAKVEKQFFSVLKGRMKDYQAALLLQDRMAELLDYDTIGLKRWERLSDEKKKKRPDNLRNIYGALVEHKAVCVGYAKGYQYLLHRLGLECLYVSGKIRDGGGGHAWNILRLKGKYYHVDVTFGDNSETDSRKSQDFLTRCYFGLTDEEMKKNRTFDSFDVALPVCNSSECNYYRIVSLYFEKFDKNTIYQGMVRYLQAHPGERQISIRLANRHAYLQAKQDLIKDAGFYEVYRKAFTKKKLFGYTYTEKDDFCTLTFIWK